MKKLSTTLHYACNLNSGYLFYRVSVAEQTVNDPDVFADIIDTDTGMYYGEERGI